ncbi:hypothetical protein [Clostridium sp. YIM B02555]|uniref:hypothetical protein n=1 Tax=Clostridium sp. YIM B02555 TaxID=2911968 RepID=UPI001EEE09A6
MKNRIIATIIGMSMMLTCSPVFARDNTIVKHVNNVKLEDKSTELSSKASNSDMFKTKLKLGKPEIKFNENYLKNVKENVKSKSNFLAADNQTTTGSAVTINDSPNNAYTIDIGSVYGDSITSEGAERWYAFNNSFIQKLTVIMQAPNSTNIDYDLYLFKYNEQTNDLDLVADSLYSGSANEHLSTIGQKGIYFIGINSVKGFDDKNQFQLAVMSSDKYGSNEPDDNIFQAKEYANSLSIEDTIDNEFDEDWSKLQLNEDTNGILSFQNSSSKGDYEVKLYDENRSLIATLKNNNSLAKTFPKGIYYTRVLSLSGADPDATYKLKFEKKVPIDSNITRATITNISTNANGGYMDYGYGKKWRVYYEMTVQGTAYNKDGIPVANQPIAAGTVVRLNNKPCNQTGMTDANGNFSISIHLGPAVGEYSFDNRISTHYYDIIPFFMVAGNGEISTNVNSLYHFAYSMYN